jgi:hypothetical protein
MSFLLFLFVCLFVVVAVVVVVVVVVVAAAAAAKSYANLVVVVFVFDVVVVVAAAAAKSYANLVVCLRYRPILCIHSQIGTPRRCTRQMPAPSSSHWPPNSQSIGIARLIHDFLYGFSFCWLVCLLCLRFSIPIFHLFSRLLNL